MSARPQLRAFVPDPSPAEPFRSDCATVRQVLDWYRTNNPLKSPSAKANKERERLWRLFADRLGDRLCADCRPHDLLAFVNRDAGDNAWTRKRWNGTIQRPFNFAAKLGLIDRNPFKGLTFPEGQDGRDWTHAEYLSLLRLACPAMRCFLVGIRFSGMRPGEVRGLQWSSIKYENNEPITMVLDDHKTKGKTRKPRLIPVNSVMAKLLKWLRRKCPPNAKHVFRNSYGNRWTVKAFDKNFGALRARAELPDDVKLHGGRHYFATQAIINGVDVAELSELLGHTNLKTTQRYVHMAGKTDHLSEAMERAIHARDKKSVNLLEQIANSLAAISAGHMNNDAVQQICALQAQVDAILKSQKTDGN